MKKIAKIIINVSNFIKSISWCLFHNVKYARGLRVKFSVKKGRKIKLVLGKNVNISNNVLFWGNGLIEIGDHSSIGSWSRIYSSNSGGVKIGDNFVGASHLYIIDSNHSFAKNELIVKQKLVSKKITIGSDVWCGYNVTILPGVKVGDGTVLGACSVLTKSIGEYLVAAGNPAKIIKQRI